MVTDWWAAMRAGDFARARQIADRLLAEQAALGPCWHLPRHEQWVWDGRPLDSRRVLVRCYHGLGDTIQFARFLPRLVDIARAVVVWAQPRLLPLLASMQLPIELLPLHDGTPETDYEVDIELMEVPHALRIDLASVPARVPYFCVPPGQRLASAFSLGGVAEAGDWDAKRSVPAELLGSLADLPGLALFSLQLGEPVPGATDISSADVLTVASRVRALDLVITPDTMMAHLAGALGVPTWTLLPAHADWRWMEDRTDSPWYPTMRLFRQPQPGDWAAVISDVRTRLRGLVRG
ncbi:MAG TPA: hypothetical protein VFA49_00740 [Chloroflexota bacterium]|nr:hypothetical protein [Chloroflexota bacterium]